MALGFTGKGVRALGDLGDGAEHWEGRLQPGFLQWDARGWGRCICVGSTPAWGLKPLPGRGDGTQASQSQVGFNREKGCSLVCGG